MFLMETFNLHMDDINTKYYCECLCGDKFYANEYKKHLMSAPHITWFVNTNIIRPITIKERPKVSIFDNLIMDNIRNEKIFFERDKKR